MATRVNMLKLVQEIEGFSGMADRRPIHRPPPHALMVIEIKSTRRSLPPRRRHSIPIRMLDLADIPNPVPIQFKPTASAGILP